MLSVVGSISLRGGARMTTKALGALITAMGVVAGGLPAEAQGPIRIGASLSLTGTYAKLGRNQHEGYKLCVKDLNTDRKSTRLNSSHSQISYAVFCLKKKKKTSHIR